MAAMALTHATRQARHSVYVGPWSGPMRSSLSWSQLPPGTSHPNSYYIIISCVEVGFWNAAYVFQSLTRQGILRSALRHIDSSVQHVNRPLPPCIFTTSTVLTRTSRIVQSSWLSYIADSLCNSQLGMFNCWRLVVVQFQNSKIFLSKIVIFGTGIG